MISKPSQAGERAGGGWGVVLAAAASRQQLQRRTIKLEMPLLRLSRQRRVPWLLCAAGCDRQLSLARGLHQGASQPPPGSRSLSQYISARFSLCQRSEHTLTLADITALCPDTSLRLPSGGTARAPRELSTTLPPLPGATGTPGLPGASAQAARTLQGSLQFHYTVRS